MITPVMYLLSCLTENYEKDKFIDVSYLNNDDHQYLMNEVSRIGSILMCESESGPLFEEMAIEPSPIFKFDSTALIGDRSFSLNPFTLALLSVLRECYQKFTTISSGITAETDLGSDIVILSLERNVNNAYRIVCEIIENSTLTTTDKALKLKTLYTSALAAKQNQQDVEMYDQEALIRLETLSKASYWAELLMRKNLELGGETDKPVTVETLKEVRKDLKSIGISGFADPYKMYVDYTDSRVHRKVAANLSSDMLLYLSRVSESWEV